jgi:hypothetical protein
LDHLVDDDGLPASLSHRPRTASLPPAANRGLMTQPARDCAQWLVLDLLDCLEQKRARCTKI